MLDINPINYKLNFEPNFQNFTFKGKETIKVNLKKNVKKIVLNSAELKINELSIITKKGEISSKFKLNPNKEELYIDFNDKISGEIEIKIDFEGIHNDKMSGFYRSLHKFDNKIYNMVTTQFEAVDARRAFPCFDEPKAKATFDIELLVPTGLQTISNMPIKQKKKKIGKNLFIFDTTPIMSTYLLYLGVGDFDYLEDNLRKTKMRVITPKGKRNQGKIALDLAKKFLNYYENYFKIPFPLPKIDFIAIPDFASGAMENWGAITFREIDLLFDEKNSSKTNLHRIAEVIAHELAHQWFGNLVTMKWWNDLWLNESFATFMATKAVNDIFPEWEFENNFILDSVNSGMRLDSLKSSHPINVKVTNPSEVNEIFDEISYDKGGSILRMLEDYIGKENFRNGLNIYLNRHKYGNTETNDLWKSLTETSKKPIKEIMDTWIQQVGYPIIETNLEDLKLTLNQKRFLLMGNSSGKESWMIPLSIRTEDKFISDIMKTNNYKLNIDNNTKWLKINFGQKGFYRVKYDKKNIEKLKNLIENKQINNIDRWGLCSDFFSLSIAGEYELKEYLNFIESFRNEKDYLVLLELGSNLYSILLKTFNENFSDIIKQENIKFFRRVLDYVGWDPIKEEEISTIPILRSLSIIVLGKLGDMEVVNEARSRFDEYLKDSNTLRPDLRNAVFSLITWYGNEKTQKMFINLYKNSELSEERIRYLSAISGFKDKKLILNSLDFSLSKYVRSQDILFGIARVESNPYAKDLIWPWMKNNWKLINMRLGSSVSNLVKRIIGTLVIIDTLKEEKEIEAFFKKNTISGTEMGIKQTLERIKIGLNFLDRIRKEFSQL